MPPTPEPSIYVGTRDRYHYRVLWLGTCWGAYIDAGYSSRYLGDFPSPTAAQAEIDKYIAEELAA